jgi:phosphoglycolate phosphatase
MHVIFDLDGTLADTHTGIAEAFDLAVRQVLPGTKVESFTNLIGPPVREVFRKVLACDNEAILDQLHNAFRNYYDGGTWKNSRPYPGIEEFIEILLRQGATLSVLTNKPTLPTFRILEHLEFREYFEAIISPDSRNPSFSSKKEAAAALAADLNLTQDSTWLIGDSEDDAAAAADRGFHFAAAAYGYGKVHLHTKHPIHLTIQKSEDICEQFQLSPTN